MLDPLQRTERPRGLVGLVWVFRFGLVWFFWWFGLVLLFGYVFLSSPSCRWDSGTGAVL